MNIILTVEYASKVIKRKKQNISTDAKQRNNMHPIQKKFQLFTRLLHPLFKVISIALIWKVANYNTPSFFKKTFHRTPSNLS